MEELKAEEDADFKGIDSKPGSTAVGFEPTRVTPIDFESIALTARPSCQQTDQFYNIQFCLLQ